MPAYSLTEAYHYCRHIARSHYENFPVASRLLPRHTRDAVAVIYTFARQADDFADEGEMETATRLERLDQYDSHLDELANGIPQHDPVFIALADVVQRHHLPLTLFHDLLSAFRQDVTKKRYRDFDEVLDYCRRSANPVGRLLLYLHNEASQENLRLSDNICTALQLINFHQDLEQDYRENNRIYLPQDEMDRYGVTESDIAAQHAGMPLQRLLASQREQITAMMLQGARLGTGLHGRFGLEIRLIIEGGLAVLEKLSAQGDEVFSRPRLKKTDYLRIVFRALRKRRHLSAQAAPFSP